MGKRAAGKPQGLYQVKWKDEQGTERVLHVRARSPEAAIRKAKVRAAGGFSVAPIEGFVS